MMPLKFNQTLGAINLWSCIITTAITINTIATLLTIFL